MARIELKMWWEARNPAIANNAACFVSQLPEFDPIYASWLLSPKTQKQALPVPLGEAEAEEGLRANIGRKDDGREWPEFGSVIWGGHAGPPPFDFNAAVYADTWCHVGYNGISASAHSNSVFMRLSQTRLSTGRSWRASELRPLMKFARDVWNPKEMVALMAFSTFDLPSIVNPNWPEHERTLRPWIGWITYLPTELAARARYPDGVEVERLEDGAALVTLCEEPFEQNDAAALAKLHALEAALRPIQT